MRPFFFSAALLLVPTCVFAQVTGVQEVRAASRIDSATVYLTTARVTRVAEVNLPEGDVRVLLDDVTPRLDADSLRARGHGHADVQLMGISAENQPHAEAVSPQLRAATQKLQQLEDRRKEISDDEAVARARQRFVASLESTYAQDRSKNLALRDVHVKELTALADFVADQNRTVRARLRKDAVAKRDLEQRIALANAELQKVRAGLNRTTETIAVALHVRKPGPFTLEVSYEVPNASWSPSWDARLDPKTHSVRMTLYAAVRQASGEDWTNAKVSVSTSRVRQALFVPELEPIYLSEYTRPPRPLYGAGRAAMAPPPAAAPAPFRNRAMAGIESQMSVVNAVASVGLLSTTYTAPRRETVKGTGEVRRSFLADYDLKAKVERKVAARLTQKAFLVATAQNGTGIPLLAGPANVFLGDDMVGKTQLSLTPAGEKLKLAFGADDRIRVKRRILERKHDTSGFFSKDEVLHYRIRTTVKNTYPYAVEVALLDQVPVSRNDEVKVKVLDASTKPSAPADPMKPGVRHYDLKLSPGQTRAVDLVYDVSWPEGKHLSGLE